MKWNGKVDEKTKEKIDLLLREFDRFILETHEGGAASEDKKIVQEWRSFKSVIEKDPTDIESLHAYINSIQQERPQSKAVKNTLTVSRSISGLNNSRSSPKKDQPFELDKNKLKRTTRQLVEMVGRNNREVLKLA